MPDVQVEHGYTRIAHPILEALALAPFNAAQLKVLLVVIRETYGWQQKDAAISYTRLEAATGLHRDTVRNALRSLIREGVVIVVREATFSEPAVYRLQKDPHRWGRFSTHSVMTHAQVDESQGVGQESHTPVGHGSHSVTHVQVEPAQGVCVESHTPVCAQSHTPVCVQSHTQGGQVLENSSTYGDLKIIKDNERYTTSLPTSSRARARDEALDRLRAYLGEHAGAVDRFAASAEHSPTWPAAILGLYGPQGTDPTIWQRSAPEVRPALLARALDRYAGESRPYHGRLFRRFLEAVIDEHRRNDRAAAGDSGRPAAQVRAATDGTRPVVQHAGGDPSRRSGWIYE